MSNFLQALRSFKLTITVDPKYHPKIIGRKGAIITNIRTEHDVNIQFPEKNDENQVENQSNCVKVTDVLVDKIDMHNGFLVPKGVFL